MFLSVVHGFLVVPEARGSWFCGTSCPWFMVFGGYGSLAAPQIEQDGQKLKKDLLIDAAKAIVREKKQSELSPAVNS